MKIKRTASEIARLGGKTVSVRRGTDYMRKLGRRGGFARARALKKIKGRTKK
jgi:hypothetical protein